LVAGLGFVSLLLAHGVAHADIFHCVDAGGVHVYRDSPCAAGTRTAGVFVSAPVEQRGAQDEGLRRIEELEREVAELRAALQSMQVAAPPVPAQEPEYPSVPVLVPVSPAAPVQETVYPAIPVVIVPGGCYGRACGHHRHPSHDRDDHRPVRQGGDNPQRQWPAELARGEPHDPGRKP
jgi:hypothetical protein